jgi:hypothetical protein
MVVGTTNRIAADEAFISVYRMRLRHKYEGHHVSRKLFDEPCLMVIGVMIVHTAVHKLR